MPQVLRSHQAIGRRNWFSTQHGVAVLRCRAGNRVAGDKDQLAIWDQTEHALGNAGKRLTFGVIRRRLAIDLPPGGKLRVVPPKSPVPAAPRHKIIGLFLA